MTSTADAEGNQGLCSWAWHSGEFSMGSKAGKIKMGLDAVVSPYAFVWSPYLTLTNVTFDLDIGKTVPEIWFLSNEFLDSELFPSDRRTHRQTVMHKSPSCMSTGGLKNEQGERSKIRREQGARNPLPPPLWESLLSELVTQQYLVPFRSLNISPKWMGFCTESMKTRTTLHWYQKSVPHRL